MKIKEVVNKFAEKKGIIAGICDANVLSNIEHLVLSENTPFVSKNIKKRIDPKTSLESSKSIIVIGVNYNKKYDFVCDDALRGIISIYAAQEDYHTLLRVILKELVLDIKREIGSFKHKVLVDSGGLVEKELAVKAGLGFYGKNSLVISEQFGSMFFIGSLITDIAVDTDELFKPVPKSCESCNQCIEACPSAALDGNVLNHMKCISYLTQKKGFLSNEESKLIGNHLYGCDICQFVCPHNEGKPFEIIKDINLVMPKISEVKGISDEEFNLKFGNTVINWAGVETIRRNALCVSSKVNAINT
ncbi:MAG: tRNA epoxyqueuosine(34) reductase QueG [Defluviitaleaceae bacterium]|nr:tRNA epoxyqueuosine(34) reductase QueG [Defluviitaleaceae bacterium]